MNGDRACNPGAAPIDSLMADLTLGLSFDDVLLVPGKSALLPTEADLGTSLTDEVPLRIPIVSAAMVVAAPIWIKRIWLSATDAITQSVERSAMVINASSSGWITSPSVVSRAIISPDIGAEIV